MKEHEKTIQIFYQKSSNLDNMRSKCTTKYGDGSVLDIQNVTTSSTTDILLSERIFDNGSQIYAFECFIGIEKPCTGTGCVPMTDYLLPTYHTVNTLVFQGIQPTKNSFSKAANKIF